MFIVRYKSSKCVKSANVGYGMTVNWFSVKSNNLKFALALNESSLILLILFALKCNSDKLARPAKCWLWISTKPHFTHSKFCNVLWLRICLFSCPLKAELKLSRSVSKWICFCSRSGELINSIELWLRSIMCQLLFISNSLIFTRLTRLLKVLFNDCDDALKQWKNGKSESQREGKVFDDLVTKAPTKATSRGCREKNELKHNSTRYSQLQKS